MVWGQRGLNVQLRNNPFLQCLLWDVTALFHQGTYKFPDISGGNGPSPHHPIQQVPDMQWDWDPGSSLAMSEHWHSCLAGNHTQNEQYGWWHWHAEGSCQDEPVWSHMKEEYVFPVTHSAEIACNDNKLSPMTLWHTAPDHDSSSTSKSIVLQSTGLGVALIPSSINANLTITPGETNLWLVSEEHFLPVLSSPATVGLCP